MNNEEVFMRAVTELIVREGGYVDHPNDRGGATNFGITIGTLRLYRGRSVTKSDVRALKKEEAIEIYRKSYWNKMSLDEFHHSPIVSELMFDLGVISGTGVAAKKIQTITNKVSGSKLTIDGDIGQRTIDAVKAADDIDLSVEFFKCVQDRFVQIVKGNRSQLVFLAGWINRSQHMLDIMVRAIRADMMLKVIDRAPDLVIKKEELPNLAEEIKPKKSWFKCFLSRLFS